jgi:hypothetical protein
MQEHWRTWQLTSCSVTLRAKEGSVDEIPVLSPESLLQERVVNRLCSLIYHLLFMGNATRPNFVVELFFPKILRL